MLYNSEYQPTSPTGGVLGTSLVDLTSISFADLFAQAANYSPTTVYTKGTLVYDQNTIWVYVNATPSSGNAPPTLPTISNIYWELVGAAGTFTWIAYSSSADGATDFTTGSYDTGGIIRTYIGIANNKTTATESNVYTDYSWSKFVGPAGANAKTLYLSADSQTIVFTPANVPEGAQTITLTALRQNITAALTWTTTPSVTLNGTGDVRTLTSDNFGTNSSVKVRVEADGLFDEITIIKLTKGASSTNLTPPEDWVIGTQGSQGSWVNVGLPSESRIVLGGSGSEPLGPSGGADILWKGVSDGGNDGSGGFSKAFSVDPQSSYRFAVWFYLPNMTDTGSLYLGCSTATTADIATGSTNGNPYFYYATRATLSSLGVVAGKWYLWVGYVFGSGYGTVQNSLGGIYDTEGRKLVSATDYKMLAGSTTQTIRAFQYYNTVVNSLAYISRPRVDEVTGSEPSLSDLIQSNPATIGTSLASTLSNESHSIPADATGTVLAYTGASGQMKVYYGSLDVTTSCTFSVQSNPQAITTTISSSGAYSATGGLDAGEDVGLVTYRATYTSPSGAVLTTDRVFSLGKNKTGAAGAPAKSMVITSDRQMVTFDSNGLLSPTPQNINLTVNKQNTSATVNWTIKDTAGNVLTPSSYLTNTSGDTTQLTGTLFRNAVLLYGAQGVVITATLVDGVTITDTVTVMSVKAAANGLNGTSAVVATLSNYAQSLAAYADGTVVSFSKANGLFKLYEGSTDVTDTAIISGAPTQVGCTGTINTAANTPVAGQPKGYYQVTAMSADTATITFSATYLGVAYTVTYTLSKAKGGYEIVSTLPTSNLFAGRVVFLTTDNKLYRYSGTAWITSVPATDISGTISDAQIAGVAASKVSGQLSDAQLSAISAAKITGTITGTQITDGAISTAKLAAGSVTASQIAANTILAGNIAAGTITGSEIAAGTITGAKIAAGTILASNIAANTITASQIAADTITAAQIATDAITANELQAGAVTAAKINVTQLSAISANIGTLRTASSGNRVEISDNVIKVYGEGNTPGSTILRVKLGNLAL